MSDLDHPLMQMAIAAAEESATALPYGHNLGDQMFVLNQGTIRMATVIIATSKRVTVRWTNSVRTMTRIVTPTSSIFEWATAKTRQLGLVVTALTDPQKRLINNARYSKVRVQIKEMANQQDGLKPVSPLTPEYDLVGAIMAYESGELNGPDTSKMFAYLIRTGKIQGLQGHYQRTAQMLIDRGFISAEGAILESL